MHWLTAWHRIVADFWPPDRSYVGPNIVASVVIFVYVEFRVVAKMLEHHARLGLIEQAVLHPGEHAEQAVADDVRTDT
jgi:hypothetical protein